MTTPTEQDAIAERLDVVIRLLEEIAMWLKPPDAGG